MGSERYPEVDNDQSKLSMYAGNSWLLLKDLSGGMKERMVCERLGMVCAATYAGNARTYNKGSSMGSKVGAKDSGR